MYRSVSTNRVSDDSYFSIYNQSPTSKGVSPALRALSLEANEFPQYEPSTLSEVTKKDKTGSRFSFSEKAVHLIPLILLLCALILWLSSNPANIELPIKDEAHLAKIKGITFEGEIDSDATTQVTNSQGLDMSDLGLPKHEDVHRLASTLPDKL